MTNGSTRPADAEIGTRQDRAMAKAELITLLLSRRSLPPRRLIEPAPDRAHLETILSAAATAPNHGGLRNFRVIEIAPDARPQLCVLFETAERELNPDATTEDLERAREKASHAPMLLLFVLRAYEEHPDIPTIEQHASAGAALGNMLLAIHALGFGAMAVSGHKLATKAFRKAFKLQSFEHALCFIALGTYSGPPRQKERLDPDQFHSVWGEEVG